MKLNRSLIVASSIMFLAITGCGDDELRKKGSTDGTSSTAENSTSKPNPDSNNTAINEDTTGPNNVPSTENNVVGSNNQSDNEDCRDAGQSCGPGYYCNSDDGRCNEGCSDEGQCSGINETCVLATNTCECESGFHACEGQCVSNDAVATCGTSCTPCSAPANGTATCDGVSCDFTCNSGLVRCGDGCCTAEIEESPIATGSYHTCALTTAGKPMCVGWNPYGQLGDDTRHIRAYFVDVFGLTSGVEAIVGGGSHTCAIVAGGGAKCWGENDIGQLGDGTWGSFRLTPVDVLNLTSGVKAITAGFAHTCALTIGGGVKCWGDNEHGQLGDGTTDKSITANDVTGLTSGVTAIAAGGDRTCALTTGGGVKCWGHNTTGGLGDGTRTNRLTPKDVSGLTSGVTAIAVGSFHACALTTGGGVKCWGENNRGQVGDGTENTTRLTPVDVSGLTSGATAIAAGGSHTCALTTGGGATCWGTNWYGQLGDGTKLNRPTPVDVSGLSSGVTAIAAGYRHTCATTTGGGLSCWGWNKYGQLGDGSTNSIRPTPLNPTGW